MALLGLLLVMVGHRAGNLLGQLMPGEPPAFPALKRTVFPVTAIPDWGRMGSRALWSRSFDRIPAAELIPVPAYHAEELTMPIAVLKAHPTPENKDRITTKLFYSTRHMGRYHVDSAEYQGTHNGVDLKLAYGTPVSAIAGGRVYRAGWERGFGNTVMVEHRAADGSRFVSVYAHLAQIAVQAGQDLRPGDLIGHVGTTGRTTGPHLHLQVDVWPLDAQEEFRPFVPRQPLTPAEAARVTVNPIEFLERYREGEAMAVAHQ